jgi:hypothetical protein
MDYTQIINSTLTDLGFDIVPVYNCFDVGYNPVTGWPMKLPDVEFDANTLLVLHFQDFVTPGYPVLELDRVEQHYGVHARQVLVTYWSHGMDYQYQGPVNLIEFSNHNMATCVSIANRYSEWKEYFEVNRDLAWQCLNGRMCPHRLRVAEVLKSWPNGTLSYGDQILLPKWAYSTYRGTENDENFIRLASLYARTKVNIVTETLYDARPGIVSEKTLMAMIAGQIPIVIGHPGIVKDCQELGFDMFEDLVDTTYDYLPNDQRAEQAIHRNRDLILGNIDLAPYKERLEAQKNLVLDDYSTIIELRFIRDCKRLAHELLQK